MAQGKRKTHHAVVQQPDNHPDYRKFFWLICGLLLLIFFSMIGQEFVNYDDDWMIYENNFVTELSRENLAQLFSTFYYGQYSPLSMLILSLVFKIGSGNVIVFKTGAILIHLINAILVFGIFRKLFSDIRSGLIAMAFFAVHPVQIESIAWLSASYKVGIFALFTLAGLYFWIKYLENKKVSFYVLAVVMMISACFSKEQALIFPLFIILISWYKGIKILRLNEILKFVPFAAVSLVFVIVSFLAVASRAEVKVADYSLIERIFFLSYSFISYLRLLFLPINLAPFYGFPESDFSGYIFYPILTAVALFIIYWAIKTDRRVLFTFLFFFVSLLLTFALQVVSIRDTLYADRYLYLGVPAFFLGIVYSIEHLAKKRINTMILVVVLLLSLISFNRVRVFKNSETLWTDAINKNYNNPLAYNNRGHHYRQINQIEKALADYNEALKINPNYHLTLNNRGKVYFDRGQLDIALADFDKCLSIAPSYVNALSNRGAAHAAKNNFEAALADLNRAIELEPGNLNALSNRSLTFYSMNEFEKSAGDISTFLSFKPDDADMLNLRSLSLNQLGRDKEALTDLNRAIELMPLQGVFWQNRSFLFNKMGDQTSALRDIRQAQTLGLQINPAYLQMLQQNAQ
jgi:protein O-mannosyl-transferase